MPFYLRPSAPTATDALVCGDPARALAIAQHVLVQPRMSNHNRGLWGYHGETPRGRELTVQATGIGAPSAVAVLAESIELGVRRLIRIGTCAGTGTAHAFGATVVASAATAADGTSRLLGAGAETRPDPVLTAALAEAGAIGTAPVRSSDLIPGRDGLGGNALPGLHDLQTAAVFALAAQRGVPAAAALVVRSRDGHRLEDEPLDAALLRLADAAVAVLAATST